MYNFKIHSAMIQALAISSSTVVRATVIAQRTNNEEIGIIKAMMIAQLKENSPMVWLISSSSKRMERFVRHGEQPTLHFLPSTSTATVFQERCIRQLPTSTSKKAGGVHYVGRASLRCFEVKEGEYPPPPMFSKNGVYSKKANKSIDMFKISY